MRTVLAALSVGGRALLVDTALPLRTAWLGSLAVNLAIMATGVATGILAARLLGPEDRGALAFVQFWPPLITALVSMSLGEAVIRQHALRSNRTALAITALGAAGLTALVALSLAPLLVTIATASGRPEWLWLLLAYHAVFVPLALGSAVLLGLDQCEKRWNRVNVLRILPSSTYLVALLLLWAMDRATVATLAFASIIGSIVVLAVQLYMFRTELRARIDGAALRQLFAIGARFHAANLLALLASQLDRLWLVLFFDDRALGLFVAATTFATSGIGAVIGALQLVLFPNLAARAVNDLRAARTELEVALRRSALLLLAACGAAATVLPLLVPLLFGEAFAEAAWPGTVLMLAQVPFCLRQLAARSVRAFGDARTGAISEVAYLVVFPALAPGLGATLDLIGIAAAVLCANCAALLPVAVLLARRHGITASSWLVPSRTMICDGWALAVRLVGSVLPR